MPDEVPVPCMDKFMLCEIFGFVRPRANEWTSAKVRGGGANRWWQVRIQYEGRATVAIPMELTASGHLNKLSPRPKRVLSCSCQGMRPTHRPLHQVVG